ncbi:MAG: RNA 2'-phosphotransferase [Rubripirellula sp.]
MSVAVEMNNKSTKSTSKFLSLVLRHQPTLIGIELDESGWIEVSVLLEAIARHGKTLTLEQLEFVVADNDKQRFAFSEDRQRIRANQGHSVEVTLGYEPAVPPEILYHGAPEKFVSSIRKDGLKKMKRHDVHLHEDSEVAEQVGRRRGSPVILTIRSGDMHRDGYEFTVSPNHVWLTDHVPSDYLS